MKKGRMSEGEKQAIIADKHLPLDELVNKYGRSSSTISELISETTTTDTAISSTITTTRQSPFIKKGGAVIMTAAAGEQMDITRTPRKLDQSYIHRPQDAV